MVSANNKELRAIGQTLNDLRTSRNRADYDMADDVGQDQCKLALAKASKAIERSRAVSDPTLRATIAALPTLR